MIAFWILGSRSRAIPPVYTRGLGFKKPARRRWCGWSALTAQPRAVAGPDDHARSLEAAPAPGGGRRTAGSRNHMPEATAASSVPP